MDDQRFVAYLQDHLAGSEVGLSVARRLSGDLDLHEAMSQLASSIEREQGVLRGAIDALGGVSPPSALTRVVGLAGSVLTVARRAVVPQPTPDRFEDLEALAVGVWGKRLLWGAIARRAGGDPRLAAVPVEELSASAEAQEIELLRLRDEAMESPVQT